MSGPLILGTNSIKDTGYDVANSVRFDGASSAYLERTFSSSGNTKTFTVSFWVKRTDFATEPDMMSDAQMLFGGQQSSYPAFQILFLHTNDTIFIKDAQASNNIQLSLKTDLTFRDPSAWYHIVLAVDTTQATASNRAKLYVNGVLQTDLAGENQSGGGSDNPLYPNQNQDLQFNGNEAHYINKYATNYEDMYMAEFVFIDGQQLAADQFGEFDSSSPNIWKPIDVSDLTFGTNGLYLDFQDASALGNDVSGNNNDFTASGLASTDQSTDTCTNNHPTWNPLDNYHAQSTFKEGNLEVRGKGPGIVYSYETYNTATMGVSSGKWYWEVKLTGIDSGACQIGIVDNVPTSSGNQMGGRAYGYSYNNGGSVSNNGSSVSGSFSSYTTGDIIGIALNLDDNELTFYKNGTVQNSGTAISITAPANTTSGFYFPAGGDENAGNVTLQANFGSPPFAISSGNSDANGYGNFEYAVPSGYYTINTKNLAEYG